MTAGWVAATTRGQALARRLVGPERAREIAAASWPDARSALMATFYGVDSPADSTRHDLSRHAVEATMWQLRVLAGWLPPDQGVLARLFAAPMEIANIEGHLAHLEGGTVDPPFRLGSLAVAWPRVAATSSSEQLRHALATSVWGDPGGTDRAVVALSLRVEWARRLAHRLPDAAPWAKGGVAVLAARELFAFEREINQSIGRVIDDLIGRHWRGAANVEALVDRLPEAASWPLAGLADAADLWRAEITVAERVRLDAGRRATAARYDIAAVAAIMALLLVDLWLVRGAIEVAGRTPVPGELFHAVA